MTNTIDQLDVEADKDVRTMTAWAVAGAILAVVGGAMTGMSLLVSAWIPAVVGAIATTGAVLMVKQAVTAAVLAAAIYEAERVSETLEELDALLDMLDNRG